MGRRCKNKIKLHAGNVSLQWKHSAPTTLLHANYIQQKISHEITEHVQHRSAAECDRQTWEVYTKFVNSSKEFKIRTIYSSSVKYKRQFDHYGLTENKKIPRVITMMGVGTHLLSGLTGFDRVCEMRSFLIMYKYSLAAVYDVSECLCETVEEFSSFEMKVSAEGGSSVCAKDLSEQDNEIFKTIFHS